MEIKKDINKYIFRGYDIRGVVPTDIDTNTAYTIGLGFGSKLRDLEKDACVVGHDNRLSSEDLHQALTKGLIDAGVNVYDLGLDLDDKTKIDYVNFEDRTNSIVSALLVNCKTFKIHNIPDIQDRVTDTFSLINNLLLMEDLDNLSAIKYINTLLKVLFTKDENRRLTYIPVKEVDNKGNYSYSEIINYNPSLEKDNKREFDNRNLAGYNFICRSSGIEYLTPRKARKIIEKSRDIDTDILSK